MEEVNILLDSWAGVEKLKTLMKIRYPRDIIWGRGSIAYLEEISRKRALIMTDKVLRRLGIVARIERYLKKGGLEVRVFDEVEPESSIDTTMKALAENKSFDPDVVIGLGGGSVIDSSKAFRIFFEHPHLKFEDIRFLNAPAKVTIPPFKKTIAIVIPTTSGTGSEASRSSVITDSDPTMPAKYRLISPEIIADIAILDPDLTDRIPPRLLAHTGLDALTHALESYVNTNSSDFTKGYSLQAITLIMKYIPLAFLQGDPVAKEHMHYASCMAGIAFGNSGCGVCHSIAGVVGITFKLAHGLANAIALPYVIKYNGSAVEELYAEIARAIGYNGSNKGEAVDYLIQRVCDVRKQLQIPDSYKESGIPESSYTSKLNSFANQAYTSRNTSSNPRESTIGELKSLIMASYQGDYSLVP